MRLTRRLMLIAAIALPAVPGHALLIVESDFKYVQWEDPRCADFDWRQSPVRTDPSDPRGYSVIQPGTPGYPIPWNPGDAINNRQCQIKPPPPPGPGDPATPDPTDLNYPECIDDPSQPCATNPRSHGYQIRYKWCLGQTKMVTDSSCPNCGQFVDRVTFLYPNDPGKDTWSLKHDVDCDGLGGIFAGNPQLADEFREAAGMPPVCHETNGTPGIQAGECPIDQFMSAGEQEACITIPLPNFPHTVVGYKFYQNVGSHHFTVWDLIHECNSLDYAEDGYKCSGEGMPFPPNGSTWNWNTKSCGAIGGSTGSDKSVFTGSQKPEMAIPFPESGIGADDDPDTPFIGAKMGKNHIFLPSTHVLVKSYPQWDAWRSSEMEIWMNVYTADPAPSIPPPAEYEPTKPQYPYQIIFEVLTGLYTFTPPYTVGLVQGTWFPPEYPTYIFGLSGHAHTRNTLFEARKIPVNADQSDHPDPQCRGGAGPLFQSTTPQEAHGCYYGDFVGTEMVALEVPGEGIEFKCWTNNGMNLVNDVPAGARQAVLAAAPQLAPRSLKWTCEQFEGVTPGLPVVQAGGFATTVPCKPDDPAALTSNHQPDAECCKAGTGPGTGKPCDAVTTGGSKGTGHCVPGHLTWGFSSDDEMCIFVGATYDLGDGIPTPWPQNAPGM